MTKYLFEFHRAKATRETLKQSISTGNLGMFRMVRERLPEGELRDRVDLMEVAAEFHQEEALIWLLREATVFERELLCVFALERKLADSLVVASENGFHPWWGRARDVSLKWRASSEMKFVSAPEGFWSEGGWWTDLSGATSALRALGSEAWIGSTLPDGRPRVGSAVEFEWTEAMSQAQFGDAKLVKSVVFPVGVRAIGLAALCKFDALESVVFPAGCVDIGFGAFAYCKALKAISLPVGCKATGVSAFYRCSSLVSVTIGDGLKSIDTNAFLNCTGLASVTLPSSVQSIGECGFGWCTSLAAIAIPHGCQLHSDAFLGCSPRVTRF
jgi:hypothetical protein